MHKGPVCESYLLHCFTGTARFCSIDILDVYIPRKHAVYDLKWPGNGLLHLAAGRYRAISDHVRHFH